MDPARLITLVSTFIVGGLGAIGVAGYMPPALVAAIVTVITASAVEYARRLEPPPAEGPPEEGP